MIVSFAGTHITLNTDALGARDAIEVCTAKAGVGVGAESFVFGADVGAGVGVAPLPGAETPEPRTGA